MARNMNIKGQNALLKRHGPHSAFCTEEPELGRPHGNTQSGAPSEHDKVVRWSTGGTVVRGGAVGGTRGLQGGYTGR